MKPSLIPALLALTSCASAPHIAHIQAQNDWLVLHLATESQRSCGSIHIGAERINYTTACSQGGKANIARQSVRFTWQAGELTASNIRSNTPLFRVQCSQAQFNQITAWQNATLSPKP